VLNKVKLVKVLVAGCPSCHQPGEKLHDWLRALFGVAADTPTL